jgi:hypothetical protein
MPIVLVQNDRTAGGRFDGFDDVTGQQFHFIEQYRPRVVPGTPFVYYRGVRLAGRGRRATPEYFGCGRIGEVWRDERVPASAPQKQRRWFCSIEEYVPFPHPVLARMDGTWLEPIPRNLLQVSVRPLSDALYRRILELAGLVPTGEYGDRVYLPRPPLDPEVRIRISDDLWRRGSGLPAGGPGTAPESLSRRSTYAKATGDRAESIVLRHLKDSLSVEEGQCLRWVAASGEKPGWDIEYRRAGELVAVEVKGTAGPLFSGVELTAREWEAAQALRERYWLYLVAECFGSAPAVQAIQDPVAEVSAGSWTLTPVLWRIASGKRPQIDPAAG